MLFSSHHLIRADESAQPIPELRSSADIIVLAIVLYHSSSPESRDTLSPYLYYSFPTTRLPRAMLSKFAAPRAFTAPARYNAPIRAAFNPVVARRSVTLDAASSHAEKDDVPDVCSFIP